MTEIYIRNTVFGIVDSLVSTVGLLSGLDVSGASRSVIILTGVIYAFVEAFSMAVGGFLSEESTEDFEVKKEVSDKRPYVAAAVMFLSFLLAAFVPIAPYLFASAAAALWLSIVFSIALLFVVGMVIARISRIHILKHAVKMVLLGGVAILIGVIVGRIVKTG